MITKKCLSVFFFCALAFNIYAQEEEIVSPKEERINVDHYTWKEEQKSTKINHRNFGILKDDFENAHQVTAACLSCHNSRADELLKSSHFRWERTETLEGKGEVALGKKNILNNFCIGVSGSEGTCTRCHIGYGWQDKTFDFDDPLNIDCLVCHDNSGNYTKKPGGAGYPDDFVDLSNVAQNVGMPSKENCGVCHFWGGGGNNVKHGDLEISLLDCSREVDVHMAADGENMTCVACHVTENHQMAGKLYALSSENKDRATCEQCHGNEPHKNQLLNQHNIRVACQTCHIPVYAKENGTKMWWDWSTAGRLDENGGEIHEADADGNHNYLSIKGTFVYNDHIIPDYYWFNGIANHQLITDKIDTIPVQMNSLSGSYKDKGTNQKSTAPSKIWPVKVHRGKQIYDPENMTLIQPKLWSENTGDSAYWKDFDWDKAAEAGMDYIGLPYSGKYDFVETEMYWPLNHMVSPKEQSLSCKDCHSRENGRLANLNDFYLPGRDFNKFLDISGISMIAFMFLFVFAHGAMRLLTRGQNKSH